MVSDYVLFDYNLLTMFNVLVKRGFENLNYKNEQRSVNEQSSL